MVRLQNKQRKYKMYSHALIQFHYLKYYLKNNFGKQECKKTQGKDPTNCIKLYAVYMQCSLHFNTLQWHMMESYDKVQTNYIERTLRNYFQKRGNYTEKEILI